MTISEQDLTFNVHVLRETVEELLQMKWLPIFVLELVIVVLLTILCILIQESRIIFVTILISQNHLITLEEEKGTMKFSKKSVLWLTLGNSMMIKVLSNAEEKMSPWKSNSAEMIFYIND
jgi:preprotein translocase subunit SecG